MESAESFEREKAMCLGLQEALSWDGPVVLRERNRMHLVRQRTSLLDLGF